jgi:Transglycosylase SLT domain
MTVYVPPQYQNWVNSAAQQLGIPVDVVAAQINLESSWNPNAVSSTGAKGLAQFEPGTWSLVGKGDPTNPGDALNAYVAYMKYLLQLESGNLQLALAAYNAGPSNTTAGVGYANQILSQSGLPTTTPVTTDNNGVSLGNSNVVDSVTTNVPMLSLDQLKSEYPTVAALVTSVPELTNIFNQAVSNTWSTDKFIAAVQNSSWWANTSSTARTAFATMKSDPATWSQNVDNLQAQMVNTAAQLGVTLTPQQAQEFATNALMGGYDQNTAVIDQKLADYLKPISGLHYGGQAGTYEQQIRQSMLDLGVQMPEAQLDNQIQQIVAGKQSVQGVTSQLRTQAAAMYPAYSQQINSGMNTSDIASPYIQRAQQLLEQGPGQMNINSPLIKSALQYTQDGQAQAMPMYNFEQQVRQQPSWLQTDNAQDAFMTNAHQVLVNFGFAY